MITILYPEILSYLKDFNGGLFPLRHPKTQQPFLVIKAPKETILSAKLKQEFRFYVVPRNGKEFTTYGVITAFFDDHDEPLTLTSPLFANDSFSELSVELLSAQIFDVHFFDEQNRELLGYRVKSGAASDFHAQVAELRFAPFSYEAARQHLMEMSRWFGLRDAACDCLALTIQFEKALFPEDTYILDLDPELNNYHGRDALSHTILERSEAGPLQELDIVMLLRRAFPSSAIYLNPFRTDENTEFTDVLVITDTNVLFVQAKDSPNTEAILARSMERKRATIVSQLEKAIRQMRGSIRYADSCVPLKLIVNEETHEISLKGRTVRCLIIVKELFSDEFATYSQMVLDLAKETKVPCIVLDYPELHRYTFYRGTEEGFIHAYDSVFIHGWENGIFPRIRFGLVPDSEPQ